MRSLHADPTGMHILRPQAVPGTIKHVLIKMHAHPYNQNVIYSKRVLAILLRELDAVKRDQEMPLFEQNAKSPTCK